MLVHHRDTARLVRNVRGMLHDSLNDIVGEPVEMTGAPM